MTARPDPPPDPPEPLWAFALATYARAEVAPLCLRLQDEHGFDVTMILACLWHGSRGGEVDATRASELAAAVAPARDRVLAIRALRRAVGSDRDRDPAWSSTYEALRAAEVAAERVALLRLESALGHAPPEPDPEPAARLRRAREAVIRCAPPEGASTPARALIAALVDAALR